jgi:hypothetical protein
MTASTRRRVFVGSWLLWTVRFLAFPIAGVAGSVVAGRVDSPTAALVGGLITGAVIGAGQWLVSRGRLRPVAWILATALGMGFGLLLGATVVGFRTSLADLAVMGALTGVLLGVGQTLRATSSNPTTLVVGSGATTPLAGARRGGPNQGLGRPPRAAGSRPISRPRESAKRT